MELNQTLTDRIYNEIKRMITNLEIKLGERINIKELSEYLHVSQTPIRETLSLLIKDGLLEYKPRKGYYYTDLTYKDIEDVYELRELIECFSLEQAAKKGSKDIDKDIFMQFMKESITIQQEGNQKIKILNYRVSDRKLHLGIVKIANNNKLNDIYLRIYPFVSITQQLDPLFERSLSEHIQIIQAILDNDISKGVNLLRGHINHCKKSGLQVLKEKLEENNKKISDKIGKQAYQRLF